MRSRCCSKVLTLQKWLLLAFLTGSNTVSLYAINDTTTRPSSSSTQPPLNICVAMIRQFAYPSECGARAAVAGCDGTTGCLEEPCRPDVVQLSLEEFSRAYDGFDVELVLGLQTLAFPDSVLNISAYHNADELLVETRPGGLCDMSLGALRRTYEASRLDSSCPRPESTAEATADYCCGLEFSRSYHRDGLALVTRQVGSSMLSMVVKLAANNAMLSALAIIVLALLASGHFIWLLERKDNPTQFPKGYLDGVDDRLWWSVVTMTTVGYGDKAPVTIMGRALGVLWMFLGLGLFGFFNAVMIACLATSPPEYTYNGPNDPALVHSKICTSPAHIWYLEDEGVSLERIVSTQNMTDCYGKLLGGEVDAVLHDRVAIMADVASHTDEHEGSHQYDDIDEGTGDKLEITSPIHGFQDGLDISQLLSFTYYAIAFPTASPLRQVVDDALLKLIDGHVVFGPRKGFRGGWTLELSAMHWNVNYGTNPLEQVHTRPHASEISSQTKTLCTVAVVSMLAYLLIQFGGLWCRMCWHKWLVKSGRREEPADGFKFQEEVESPEMKQLQQLKELTSITGEAHRETFVEGLKSLSRQVASFKAAQKSTAKMVKSMAPRSARSDSLASDLSIRSSRGAAASLRGIFSNGIGVSSTSRFGEETSPAKASVALPGQCNEEDRHHHCSSDSTMKPSKIRFEKENAGKNFAGDTEEPTTSRNLAENFRTRRLSAILSQEELMPHSTSFSSDAAGCSGEQQV